MLTRPLQAFLTLLQAGITGNDPGSPNGFPLSAREWNQVFKLARQQTVTGITFAALEKLPDRLLPPTTLLARWVASVETIERNHRRMSSALTSLLQMLEAEGLHPVLQKGHSVARYYPVPDLRESGDIDLYFTPPEWNAASEALRRNGISPLRRPDRSLLYEWQGIEVEHHTELLDLLNPLRARVRNRLIAGEGTRRITITDQAIEVNVVAPVIDLLLISTHIMKHAFGNGIGFRQICDYAVACRHHHGQFSPEAYADACRRLGISRWTSLLHEFCADYLAVPREMLPPSGRKNTDANPESLLDITLQGGNFGQYITPRRRFANKTIERKYHTLSTFLRRLKFSMRLAPAEAICSAMHLAAGQRL